MRKFTKEILSLLATVTVASAITSSASVSADEIEITADDMKASDYPIETTSATTTSTTLVGTNISKITTTSATTTSTPLVGTIVNTETTTSATTTSTTLVGTNISKITTTSTTTSIPPMVTTVFTDELPYIAGEMIPVDGDANFDGIFSVADVVTVQKYIMNSSETRIDEYSADLDKNGEIDVFDLIIMKRELLKSISVSADSLDYAYTFNKSYELFAKMQGNVNCVAISSLPESYQFNFENNDAQKIADKLLNIPLTDKFEENPDEYVGMTWIIKISYENGETYIFEKFGSFIKIEDDKWYKMSYNDSSEFDTIIWDLKE